jgi:hypothetical protein
VLVGTDVANGRAVQIAIDRSRHTTLIDGRASAVVAGVNGLAILAKMRKAHPFLPSRRAHQRATTVTQ